MELLLVMFGIVTFFSLLTLAELWFLKLLGFDVIAHLRLTSQTGKKGRFLFEAFGAIAFVVAQPIILTATTVYALDGVREEATAFLQMNAA